MARGDRNMGWPGFFRVFTVLCAMMLLLAQSGQQQVAAGSGAWQVLSVYEGLTCWAVPALFMLGGMLALEEGRPQVSASLLGLALPTFCLLVFWGAVYAVVSHLLGGGLLSWRGVWAALVSAAKGNTYFHLWVLYPLIGLYLVHPVLHRFTASASRGEMRYFLGLCLLFASLLPLWTALRPESAVAAQLERLTGQEARVTVPGHYQRGGPACPYDRVFASRLGAEAGKLIMDGQYGFMVGYRNREVVRVPLEDVAGKLKEVSPDASIVQEAKLLGISFGN